MVGLGALTKFYTKFLGESYARAPAEHVEGEAGEVEHEAGHQHGVEGGQDAAHQVEAGGGGETWVNRVRQSEDEYEDRKT